MPDDTPLGDKRLDLGAALLSAFYGEDGNAFGKVDAADFPDGAKRLAARAIRETKADKLAEALTYARRFLNPKDVDMEFIDGALASYKEIANA